MTEDAFTPADAANLNGFLVLNEDPAYDPRPIRTAARIHRDTPADRTREDSLAYHLSHPFA